MRRGRGQYFSLRTSELVSLGVLDTTAAHNIVVNTANRSDIASPAFFAKFRGAFQRLRAVTAGEALIQRLPLMPYMLRLSFSSVQAPSFP